MSKREEKDEAVAEAEAPKEPTTVDTAATYVRRRFSDELDPQFLFHNFAYAEEIADKAEELAEVSELAPDIQERLILAAYFYPIGYVEGHEGVPSRSAAILREWADRNDVDLHTDEGNAADWIEEAYSATDRSALPVRLLHDAAHSWKGRKRYDRRSDLLQLERSAIDGKEGDPVKFGREMQEELLNMRFLTHAGQQEFDQRRRKNVAKQQSNNYKVQKDEVKQKTGKNFGRGIDTVYRTSFRTHINLSRIADGKANMMISINTIILSIVITISGASLSYFEDVFFENPEFLVPIITLLLSSLTAVIFAVFSARPSVTEYRVKKDKLIKSTEASLLYFGNFLKLEKTDFVEYLSDIKLDQTALYDDLSRDLYDLGSVLHKKYLLLTISYNTFVGGLALAVISFLIVYMLNVYS